MVRWIRPVVPRRGKVRAPAVPRHPHPWGCCRLERGFHRRPRLCSRRATWRPGSLTDEVWSCFTGGVVWWERTRETPTPRRSRLGMFAADPASASVWPWRQPDVRWRGEADISNSTLGACRCRSRSLLYSSVARHIFCVINAWGK
jgi:hypothetical protein